MINVTSPTRLPGRYKLVWDGRDEQGSVIPPGDYQLMLEASREHGEHDYLNIPFTIEEGMQNVEHEGQGELGDLHLKLTVTRSL